MILLEYILFLLISLPFPLVLHEYGHVFFIRLFGGSVHQIVYGHGEVLFSIGKNVVCKNRFWTAEIDFTLENLPTGKVILVSAGGVIVNVITATFLWIIVELNYLDPSIPIRGFIIHSYLIAIYTMIPQADDNGSPNDGKAILDLLKLRLKQK